MQSKYITECDIFNLSFLCLLKWDDDPKLFEIMILSIGTLWIFAVNLMVCDFGERMTSQFDQFSVKYAQCKWISLPIEMQRIYLMFLLDTQQPKHIRTYSGIVCTRETSKQVKDRLQPCKTPIRASSSQIFAQKI